MLTSLVPVESLLDPVLAAAVWPESITSNEVFKQQLERRRELIKRLEDVICSLPRPDMPIGTAIDLGYITEEQVAALYESLSDLLQDPYYKRIVFYLPFEFLPNRTWDHFGEKLRQVARLFRQVYMDAWWHLLLVQDVRANFVDGDVLEVGQRVGDLPRVVKAAHLIPKLVENGLLEIEDVISLMEKANDQVLKDSIADALPVLADMGFIPDTEADTESAEATPKPITLTYVRKKLDKAFSRIDTEDFGSITKGRKNWLVQKKRQEAIDAAGEDICTAIVRGELSNEITASFLAYGDSAMQRVLVEGIRAAIESVALTNVSRAHALYAQYKETLLALWESDDPDIGEALSKTFRRLHYLGIVDDQRLSELGIVIPRLAGPFSKNLRSMGKDLRDIETMAASIKCNSELSRLIYPGVLMYGSRIKGYGAQNSDIDLAVFVRPGTPFAGRSELQKLLGQTFAHNAIRGQVVEFWLEEKGEILRIRDFNSSDVYLGESYWTHVLFGAVWMGGDDTIRELYEKLLTPYMRDDGNIIFGRGAISIYLEETERDTLQYRLMHKGYERFFPPCGGIHTPHSDRINDSSMFWDSGYRQLATMLFVSRVFLPNIPVV
ncbi:MAG: hypothetical protein HYV65_03315 [Candidatus Spechtbacteria bacterium]|nr:hypothetical protein [Candidatus Spechtbacteria bacterium]